MPLNPLEEEIPPLLPTTETFPSGYGARAIAISKDQRTVFIGCKDGSVIAIDLSMDFRSKPELEKGVLILRAGPETGVRFVHDYAGSDLSHGSLLVGDDLGQLLLLKWKNGKPLKPRIVARNPDNEGTEAQDSWQPITFIEEWDDENILVSYRNRDACLFSRRMPRQGHTLEPLTPAFLKGVQGVCGVMRCEGKKHLLICEDAQLWSADPHGHVEVLQRCCEEPEQPGFVSDATLVLLDSLSGHPEVDGAQRGRREVLYTSTDTGVYQLYWKRDEEKSDSEKLQEKESGKEKPTIEKVHLPGITGMCMAVSYLKTAGEDKEQNEELHFLWVSDLAGDVHMFWHRSYGHLYKAPLYWQRFGFRLESSQATRSIASVSSTGAFAICQACRNEKTVVTWYERGAQFERMADLLAWGRSADLTGWSPPKGYAEWASWEPEAQLAIYIEEAGRKPEHFTRFLASPYPERLAWDLLVKIEDRERARQAVILWTDALLGTIHRRLKDRREQQCLGVVRWLRRLAERCRDNRMVLPDSTDWSDGLLPVIEECIRHTRKWGVFGGTYSQRKDVFAPLIALGGDQVGDRHLDRIAYTALLFGRNLNVEDEKELEDSHKNRIPWDVRFLPGGQGEDEWGLIAVSWGGGGIDLYRLVTRSEGSAKGMPKLEKLKSALKNKSVELSNKEHDRSLILGVLPAESRTVYLLRSTARAAAGPEGLTDESSTPEYFDVTLIDPLTQESREAPQGDYLPRNESLYCFAELSPGLVVAGLKGSNGKACIAVVRIGDDGRAELLRRQACTGQILDLPAAFPELNQIKLNPVWSLDCSSLAASRDSDRSFDVIAGCGDGQIWKVRLKVEGGTFEQTGDPVLIGRLGAPVRSLVYIPATEANDPRPLRAPRIIAGGADGMILAFERVQGASGASEEAYATLWATREQGVISRIHAFEADLWSTNGENEEVSRLVIAITQGGMAILFSDRDKIEALPALEDRLLHRVHVPGQRLGRFGLDSTVFASTIVQMKYSRPNLVETAENDAQSRGRVARLVVATGEGTLQLLTLHYPKYTEIRHQKFRQLRSAWLGTLRGSAGRAQGQSLRRAEALYAAVPYLATLLVRWILLPETSSHARAEGAPAMEAWEAREGAGMVQPACQWVPLHLQPLVALDSAWVRLRTARGKAGRKADLERLAASFTAALRAARDVGDSRLFKEIIEVTLNRANHELFEQMRQFTESSRAGKKPAIRADWFITLLNCLKDLKGAWLGAAEGLDIKVRVVIVRNVVDGDTLWSLSEALREAKKANRKKQLSALVAGRVELIHSFLAHGDPLLSLEVLRAVNLSLARACRRLEPGAELDLGTIEGYYEAIGDFASRAVHSARNELGEALAHEVCRTYALGILACPSSALRLTHRMSETDLPLDFAGQVRLQFPLLSRLLDRPISETGRKIFEMASGIVLQGDLDSYEQNLLTFQKWKTEDLGGDNESLLLQWEMFDSIVDWLHRLAKQFSDQPDKVNFQSAREFFQKLCEADPTGHPYRHSMDFWREAMDCLCSDLDNELKMAEVNASENKEIEDNNKREIASHESRPKPIRPDLVLFSATLSKWCRGQRVKLETLKKNYQIFEPQRKLYEQALSRLERVTAGFREGTALQKNMVLGVLGHGLLEMLDEHLLGLWEVAQALDPEQTWQREDREKRTSVGRRTSRKAQFADAMLNTALKAEVIPKNLRNLQWLLCYRSGDLVQVANGEPQARENLKNLLGEFQGKWKIESLETVDCVLEIDESHFLRFILNEMEDNQGHNSQELGTPSVQVYFEHADELGEDRGRPCINLKFYCDPGKYERIKELREKNLQEPISADSDSCTRSHGTGLYLANLAAAAVGWKLRIEEPDKGVLPFKLSRHDRKIGKGK